MRDKFKKFCCGMLLAGSLLSFPGYVGAEPTAKPIPLRGIVEGFYGTPWSHENRLDILSFCHDVGFNAYIYAPKDDVYHRNRWREPYPQDSMKKLQELVSKSQENQVRFIFAVSPGNDINLTGIKKYRDREILLQKMFSLYALGTRDFAVFFDDIATKNGEGQAELLNWLSDRLKMKDKECTLMTVPTEYFYLDMLTDNKPKEYTEALRQNLAPDILLLYTGAGVVCPGITDAEYRSTKEIYQQPLGIWWNYPVNDYMLGKLALGPIENLPTQEDIPAVFFNPMEKAQLSKLALATGADYALAPAAYQPECSWQQACKKQYGNLAEEVNDFARQSQHLENNWAKVGPAESRDLQELIDLYEGAAFQEEKCGRKEKLQEKLTLLRGELVILKYNLSPAVLAECQPQLEQLSRIISAVQYSLSLQGRQRTPAEKDKMKYLQRQVQEHDDIRIAEPLRNFLSHLEQFGEK